MKKNKITIEIVIIILLSNLCFAQHSNVMVHVENTDESINDAKKLIQSAGGQTRVIFTSGKILAYLPDQSQLLLTNHFQIDEFNIPDEAISPENIENQNTAGNTCLPPDFQFQNSNRTTNIYDRITSSYMIGSCRVDMIMVESDGNTFNWSDAEKIHAIEQVTLALNWWAERAAEYDVPFYFVLNDEPFIANVPNEPINESSGLFILDPIIPRTPYSWPNEIVSWMENALNDIGYPSSNWDGIFNLVNEKRSESATDWGFSIFIVDNANDDDIIESTFADSTAGFTMMWPETYLGLNRLHGGPCFVLASNGTNNNYPRWETYAHEIGHIFGAPDEYFESFHCSNGGLGDTCDEYYGYLYEQNDNCELCSDPQENCIMRDSPGWDPQNPESFFCEHTPIHLGWWDSDQDGPKDPIDKGHYIYGLIPNVNPGDEVKIFTYGTNEFVKHINVTNENSLTYNDVNWILWDGTNYGFGPVAPNVYSYKINDQEEQTLGYYTNSVIPVITNINTGNSGFEFTLSETFAYIRAKATSQNTGEEFYLLRDQLYGNGTHQVNCNLPFDIYDLEIFGWKPNGDNSNIVQFILEINTNNNDVVWSGMNNILNNITIPSQSTLTILQGTTVNFSENVELIIEGNLVIDGTESQPVTLSSANQWGGIQVSGNATITINHGIIENADTGVEFSFGQSQAEISNTLFNNCQKGIYDVDGESGLVTIINSVFINCSEFGIRLFETERPVYLLNNSFVNSPVSTDLMFEQLIIENNLFNNSILTLENTAEFEIKKNIFDYSEPHQAIHIKIPTGRNDHIFNDWNIINNTLYCSSNGNGYRFTFSSLGGSPNIKFMNNILIGNNQNSGNTALYVSNYSSLFTHGGSFDIDYNQIWGFSNQSNNETIDLGEFNSFENPLLLDVFNDDFNLHFNSPCIDTGHPDLDNDGNEWQTDMDDQDPDGTRMDIGAYYYDAIPPAPVNLTSNVESNVSCQNCHNTSSSVELAWEETPVTDLSYYTVYRADYAGNCSSCHNGDNHQPLGDRTELMDDPYILGKDCPNLSGEVIGLSRNRIEMETGCRSGLPRTRTLEFTPLWAWPLNYWIDLQLTENYTYSYYVSATDDIEQESTPSNFTIAYVPVNGMPKTVGNPLPLEYAFHLAYPNPFNPTTTMKFDLPFESNVTLNIYNVMGQLVRTIEIDNIKAGFHQVQWKGITNNGQKVPSGMYIVRMNAISIESKKSFHKSQKVVLLK
ncbi:MAG: T9SS type A sorting domain-containing protein [Candidatus Marinimicrobia bacterium]|nr:T9SS type A sorting domain-containing protein [Candidatus Neomarinimicrobiota bacterium]MBT3502748.1 T9SS type A sorting domain-containing protein [Candidatus Neomarinimicrobiota bacterium]MBT3838932.1 T9SS type A sorting domain-containing protein [Candidatus Neomarinimicrobiota bacterium]MBT4000356.1 T9SS type A sorting domain-containing protein [Candidatus Neomarinimicrobiota bacterium]MBT4283428.1 T9SS type A sorting domain-containing protein [Candidatus Neomarinimicrobiota bacterium]